MGSFIRHYLEMVVAMFAGMIPFGLATRLAVGDGFGVPHDVSGTVDSTWGTLAGIASMDLAMIVPMVLWMRYRGHSWRHGAEMSLAMVVPTIPIHAAGFIWPEFSGAVNVASHVAMLLGMLALMIVQRAMYAGHPHGPASAHAGKLPGSPVGR